MTLTRALQARRLFAPIYAVFNDLRRGEVTLHGAVPVFQDWSGEWFELRAAIEGWCDCWTRIQAERDIGFDPRPLRQLAARLHYGTPVSPAEIAAARNAVRQTAPELAAWQLRDMRKTSLNDAETLEEARRRAKHTDPRTTARHYEVRIDAVPGNLPKRNEG